MDCGMGMRAVRTALCRIWMAVGICSCSEYKECSYSHSFSVPALGNMWASSPF